MMPPVEALRAEVTDGGEARLVAIGDGGDERELAAWTSGPAFDVDLLRSPSGDRVGVAVEGTTWTFARDGTLVAERAAGGRGERAGLGGWGGTVLHWTEDEELVTHRPNPAGPFVALVAPGVTVSVAGPTDDHGDETSSGSGALRLYWTGTPTDAQREADVAARRAEARAAVEEPLSLRVAVVRDGRETVVQDARAALTVGVDQLQWPPFAGPGGVLLRWLRTWADVPADDAAPGVAGSEQEVGRPTLVAPDGSARTLPFELGNRLLTTLPDGRILLPCLGPMWWDGADEGMSALDEDGDAELLTLGDGQASPLAFVDVLAPELSAGLDRSDIYRIPGAWTFTSARVDGGTLRLALQRHREEDDDATPWLLADVPLDGVACGTPRLVARGATAPGGAVRVIV
jgi:hypothetical protein